MKLRKLARGKPCQIRLPGICNGNRETTVLAHYRLAGISGIGMKSPDYLGAWSCSACHDAVDGRRYVPGMTRGALHLAHAEGVFRTLYAVNECQHPYGTPCSECGQP